MEAFLADPWLRFSHLYMVKDKTGQVVPFTPWPEQVEFYWSMWYLNVVLKARQRGLTTGIQLFMLDRALFNDNVNAGVIAHSLDDAMKFFADKIKFAYEHLPPALLSLIGNTANNESELRLSNGSSVRVGTSLRSGTYQYLHVSEFGKICAQMPHKAREIVTGAFNTVTPGQFIYVESTAEGSFGRFADMCRVAEKMALDQTELTPLDYKFFFYPWWRAPEYAIETPIHIPEEDARYFRELHDDYGISLTDAQKYWWVRKASEQGEDMLREYPATSDDAFKHTTQGAVYGKQLKKARKERRILPHIPHLSNYPVHTFWDLGLRDQTAIWFMQLVGPECRFINYYANKGEPLDHYARKLDTLSRSHSYSYGQLYLPHDAEAAILSRSDNASREKVLKNMGFKTRIVPRIPHIEDGIEMTRQAFAYCYFDETNCADGLLALESYRYEWDEKRGCYKDKPLHDWASDGADAFRQFAQHFNRTRQPLPNDAPENPLTRAARAGRTGRGANRRRGTPV